MFVDPFVIVKHPKQGEKLVLISFFDSNPGIFNCELNRKFLLYLDDLHDDLDVSFEGELERVGAQVLKNRPKFLVVRAESFGQGRVCFENQG